MRSTLRARWARLSLGLVTALSLAVLVAAPATAGGYATVTLDGTPPTPNAGQPAEIIFTLKQHGVTPIDWEQATVVATNDETGQVIRTVAEPRGNGHYAAIVTFPSAGTWSWTVELRDLLAQAQPFPAITVLPAPAAPATPTVPAAAIAAAVALAALAVVGVVLLARRRGLMPLRIPATR